jgi:hypothetical protein
MCAKYWWGDLDPTKEHPPGSKITREMPSFSYQGVTRRVLNPDWKTGIFMVLPIHQIAIVRDPENKTHEPVFEKVASKLTGLPLELVDQ